jgi:hypothetical protein
MDFWENYRCLICEATEILVGQSSYLTLNYAALYVTATAY